MSPSDSSEMASSSSSEEDTTSQKNSPPPNVETALEALHDAAREAVSTIGRYATTEPFEDAEEDDPRHAQNPWKDMPTVASSLEQAGGSLEAAWKAFGEAHAAHRVDDSDDSDLDDDSDSDSEDSDSEDSDDKAKKKRRQQKEQEAEFRAHDADIDPTQKVDLDVRASLEVPISLLGNVDDKKEETKRDNEAKQEDDNSDSDSDIMPGDDFRAAYIEMMTEAFADDLANMSSTKDVNVDILVEALASGVDFLDPSEKNRKSYLEALGTIPVGGKEEDEDEAMMDANKNNDDGELTVHQRRQKRLGYLTDFDDEVFRKFDAEQFNRECDEADKNNSKNN